MKKNNKMWAIYILLFCSAYISVYIDYNITPIFVWPILIFSYYLILVKKRVEPVLFLILSSKFITGFAVPTNNTAFVIANVLVNYLPVFIVFVMHTTKWGHIHVITKYKFTLIYLLMALAYSAPYAELAVQLIIKEYFPLLLFLLTSGIFYKKIDYSLVIQFLRPLLICSLIIYAIPNNFDTNIILNTLPLLSRVPTQESIEFISLDVFRNGGFFWDTRIMGVLCYVFIYISLTKVRENFKINLFVAIVVLLSTLSRGAIGVGGILLFTYIMLEVVKGRFVKPILISIAISIVSVGAIAFDFIEVEEHFFNSFLLTSENNALSQRAGFREHALEEFYDKPLGQGVGYLKGAGPNRNIPVGGVKYDTVTDAFLFTKLAEMGILGFILFTLSLSEIILSRNIYSLALILGVFIQLTGTDVPDTKQFYFVFLVLLSSLNLKFDRNHFKYILKKSKFG